MNPPSSPPPSHDPGLLEKKVQQLTTLLSLNTAISASTDIHSVLRLVSLAARQAVNAEASALLLLDVKTRQLYFETAAGEKSRQVREMRVPLGQGIAGWVAERGESLLINDPYQDPRFFKEADQKSGFTTRNLLCVPIKLKHSESTLSDQIVGVLEVLNKREGAFTPDDQEVIQFVANQAAVTIENSRLFKTLRITLAKLKILQVTSDVTGAKPVTRRILIVDDDPLHVQVVSQFLTEHGFEVQTAKNGEEAVHYLKHADPDLCLCLIDMVMPGLDGNAVVNESLRNHPEIPLFIITSNPNHLEVSRALMKGASEVIVKPLTPDYLLNRVLVKIEAALH